MAYDSSVIDIVIGGVACIIYIFYYLCKEADSDIKSLEEVERGRRERLSYQERIVGRDGLPVGYAKGIPQASSKKPIPGLAQAISEVSREPAKREEVVKALRGGEFIGNRMRFKVKVLNDSPYVISDVTVYLISYPKDALRLANGKKDIQFSKIEPNGFRSPSFDFLPTQDCVMGEIIAGVSYIDMTGKPHTLTTKPFIIRSVCDLLIPEKIGSKEFEIKLQQLNCGEVIVKVDEWSPEEMFEKALRIVNDANFFEVSSQLEVVDNFVHAKITGLAKGKYTGKNIAVVLLISGRSEQKGASCTIRVSGEDHAMILPAIDDLRERLSAWLCPMCSSPLTLANVENLKDGKAVQCPFCGITIGR
ncbi:MAG: hypothetical protein JW779_02590 [Candidatus Thorarchaeota archaeon]|nr:hypothetical protein [Candidatus Thorarchaeota archaeon]